MQKVYQFFRLIRLSNIMVIILTMAVFYALLSHNGIFEYTISEFTNNPDGTFSVPLKKVTFTNVHFTDQYFLSLILSVVLIAASGNIINDYFDVKADRINKPKRLIIDKHIKRRWAIILNWTFNGIGFLIAIYLSFLLENWWIALVAFLAINLLYFYSAIYKRKFLTGNLIVAFLTAIVPLEVYIYKTYSNFEGYSPFEQTSSSNSITNFGYIIFLYCAFAFLLNLIREIIKDMADVKGDLLLKSQTIPIKFGFKKAKYLLLVLYVITLTPLLYFTINTLFGGPVYHVFPINALLFKICFSSVPLFLLVSLITIVSRNQPKYYTFASNMIKIAMLFGVLSALFIL